MPIYFCTESKNLAVRVWETNGRWESESFPLNDHCWCGAAVIVRIIPFVNSNFYIIFFSCCFADWSLPKRISSFQQMTRIFIRKAWAFTFTRANEWFLIAILPNRTKLNISQNIHHRFSPYQFQSQSNGIPATCLRAHVFARLIHHRKSFHANYEYT